MRSKPIEHRYPIPTNALLNDLKNKKEPVVATAHPRIKFLHSYEKIKLKATLPEPYLRRAVFEQLSKAVDALPARYEIHIFDAFRTIETQLSLFQSIYDEQRRKDPSLNHEEAWQLTRKFVAHPNDVARFAVPPHNTGGAIDLSIAEEGVLLDMGTDFDEVSPLSETTAFERPWDAKDSLTKQRWETVRENRRLLFHAMVSNGFVNYEEEWWHYDLGDGIWSTKVGSSWFYDSMEPQIPKGQKL